MDKTMFSSNVQPKRVIKAYIPDWFCPHCGLHNRFNQPRCLECNKEVPKGVV